MTSTGSTSDICSEEDFVPPTLSTQINRLGPVSYSSSPLVLLRRDSHYCSDRYTEIGSSDEEEDSRCEFEIRGVAVRVPPSEVPPRAELVPTTVTKRTYRHLPNTRVNAMLTFISLLAIFAALGLGIGHFYGTHDDKQLQIDQLKQMKTLQDHYMICLRNQKTLFARIDKFAMNTTKDKLLADEWKENYNEIISQKISMQIKLTKILSELQELKLQNKYLKAQIKDKTETEVDEQTKQVDVEYSETYLKGKENYEL